MSPGAGRGKSSVRCPACGEWSRRLPKQIRSARTPRCPRQNAAMTTANGPARKIDIINRLTHTKGHSRGKRSTCGPGDRNHSPALFDRHQNGKPGTNVSLDDAAEKRQDGTNRRARSTKLLFDEIGAESIRPPTRSGGPGVQHRGPNDPQRQYLSSVATFSILNASSTIKRARSTARFRREACRSTVSMRRGFIRRTTRAEPGTWDVLTSSTARERNTFDRDFDGGL